jgi:hypothetical protein
VRRYLWLFVAALVSVGVTAGVAWSATDSGGATSSEHRYIHFYAQGPSESCDGDACGIGEATAITVRLPAASHPYSGTVSVSLGYVTRGDAEFRLTSRLRGAGGVVVLPASRILGPATKTTSTTVVFELRNVPGAKSLALSVGATFAKRHSVRAAISTRDVLVEGRFATT